MMMMMMVMVKVCIRFRDSLTESTLITSSRFVSKIVTEARPDFAELDVFLG